MSRSPTQRRETLPAPSSSDSLFTLCFLRPLLCRTTHTNDKTKKRSSMAAAGGEAVTAALEAAVARPSSLPLPKTYVVRLVYSLGLSPAGASAAPWSGDSDTTDSTAPPSPSPTRASRRACRFARRPTPTPTLSSSRDDSKSNIPIPISTESVPRGYVPRHAQKYQPPPPGKKKSRGFATPPPHSSVSSPLTRARARVRPRPPALIAL